MVPQRRYNRVYQQQSQHQEQRSGAYASHIQSEKINLVMQVNNGESESEGTEESESSEDDETNIIAFIDYKTHEGWKNGKILTVNENGTYEIRQDNGAIGKQWRSENIRFRPQQEIEYNSVNGWLKGSVISANHNGTYEIKQNNGTIGHAWRCENVRVADPKKIAINFLNKIKPIKGQQKKYQGISSPRTHEMPRQAYPQQSGPAPPPLPFINSMPTTNVISKTSQPPHRGSYNMGSHPSSSRSMPIHSSFVNLTLGKKSRSKLSALAKPFNPRSAKSTSFSTTYPLPAPPPYSQHPRNSRNSRHPHQPRHHHQPYHR